MFAMDRIHRIRELYYQQGMSLAEIARELDCDWRTVRKYVDMEDFNQEPPKPESVPQSKLNKYKPIITGWLAEDKSMPRKQRHTAKRVFDRLKKIYPDFDCSYRLVAEFVSETKKDLRLSKKDGAIPLEHGPGEAQGDFGTADFQENGRRYHEAKYFVLSFPWSNGGYLQLNYGENMECLLESLVKIFEHLGGVPTEIWFDNTKTVVTKIIKDGGREVNERFLRFSEHYRFRPVFMNPDAGNEKGNVENKVGYLRRNELVPLPKFKILSEFNQDLLKACDEDMRREHYDKELFINELFEQDRNMLLPLPSVPFDTRGYETARTDKYGRFTLDKGKHRYSASPGQAETTVHLILTSSEVTVLDSDFREIVRHRRLYGEEKGESMDWIPYLKYIARKPRSLRNSGIYELMPEEMRRFMDSCESAERGRVLKVLAELTERAGFESALTTVDAAIRCQAHDADSLKNLYRRLFTDVPELPPLSDQVDEAFGTVIPFHDDLSIYDKALKGGVRNG